MKYKTKQKELKEERLRIAELERRVIAHNSTLIPERPGIVRYDGPRRQFEAYHDGRELHLEEI